MHEAIDKKRTWIFLAFAFGIAWLAGLVIYLTGGLVNSPRLFGNVPLALVLMATFYMWAPALANILTRLITREGWGNTGLRPKLRRGWPYWLAAWFLPGIFVILGMGLYFLLFPHNFDPSLAKIQAALQATGRGAAVSPWMVVISQTLAAFLIAPPLNAIATFGEEFGWRAYLLPKLVPAGSTPAVTRKALLLMGLIWGVWHWPLIFMGYEYGLKYPGSPWLGPILFCLFTFTFGVFQGWVTLRSGSVWPAVIGHGAINGIANLPLLFATGTYNLTIGPAVIGIVGGIPFLLLAALLLLLPGALRTDAAEESLPVREPAAESVQ
jgi:uncharacterized protein